MTVSNSCENKKSECPWCHDGHKCYVDFSVFDEDCLEFVHPKLVKFCPFCGRNIEGGEK